MDLIQIIETVIIFSSIIILPLIWIRIRGNKESSQYQERISQDWRDTIEYRGGEEYLKVMRIDKELERNKQRVEANSPEPEEPSS
ncbi:MAG: hypothetical protein NTY03_04475 [Candidatus Bathyarchaeota archaeon]|nr:hypothetical protein [Candidatus Bathyarchaeota archaeon]